VTDPEGTATQPPVEDFAQSEGCYKVPFIGSKTGKHKGHIFVLGEDVNPEGFSFYVHTRRADTSATFSRNLKPVLLYSFLH
jgi:hypothetical protein